MTQFVSGIKAAPFSRFHRVQEDERLTGTPERKCVYLPTLFCNREDPDAALFQEMHHISDRPLPQLPLAPKGLGSSLRICTSERRKTRGRQVETLLQPIAQLNSERSCG